MSEEPDQNQLVTYPMRMPRWLSQKVSAAANKRAQSAADWLRQAAIEKLNRDEGES
jgi:hypothetical protein